MRNAWCCAPLLPTGRPRTPLSSARGSCHRGGRRLGAKWDRDRGWESGPPLRTRLTRASGGPAGAQGASGGSSEGPGGKSGEGGQGGGGGGGQGARGGVKGLGVRGAGGLSSTQRSDRGQIYIRIGLDPPVRVIWSGSGHESNLHKEGANVDAKIPVYVRQELM